LNYWLSPEFELSRSGSEGKNSSDGTDWKIVSCKKTVLTEKYFSCTKTVQEAARREKFPQDLKFGVFLLTFQWKDFHLLVSCWQREMSPLSSVLGKNSSNAMAPVH